MLRLQASCLHPVWEQSGNERNISLLFAVQRSKALVLSSLNWRGGKRLFYLSPISCELASGQHAPAIWTYPWSAKEWVRNKVNCTAEQVYWEIHSIPSVIPYLSVQFHNIPFSVNNSLICCVQKRDGSALKNLGRSCNFGLLLFHPLLCLFIVLSISYIFVSCTLNVGNGRRSFCSLIKPKVAKNSAKMWLTY